VAFKGCAAGNKCIGLAVDYATGGSTSYLCVSLTGSPPAGK
jgi:hypothetical protein